MMELGVSPKFDLLLSVEVGVQNSIDPAALRSKDVSIKSKAVRCRVLTIGVSTSWQLGSEPKDWIQVVLVVVL